MTFTLFCFLFYFNRNLHRRSHNININLSWYSYSEIKKNEEGYKNLWPKLLSTCWRVAAWTQLCYNSCGQHGPELLNCLIFWHDVLFHKWSHHVTSKISMISKNFLQPEKTVELFHCLDSICSPKMSHVFSARCALLLIPKALFRGIWLAQCTAHLGREKSEYLRSLVCLIYVMLCVPQELSLTLTQPLQDNHKLRVDLWECGRDWIY